MNRRRPFLVFVGVVLIALVGFACFQLFVTSVRVENRSGFEFEKIVVSLAGKKALESHLGAEETTSWFGISKAEGAVSIGLSICGSNALHTGGYVESGIGSHMSIRILQSFDAQCIPLSFCEGNLCQLVYACADKPVCFQCADCESGGNKI